MWQITCVTPLSQWYGGADGSGKLPLKKFISGHCLHLGCRCVIGRRNDTDHNPPSHATTSLFFLLLHSSGFQKLNVPQVFFEAKDIQGSTMSIIFIFTVLGLWVVPSFVVLLIIYSFLPFFLFLCLLKKNILKCTLKVILKICREL